MAFPLRTPYVLIGRRSTIVPNVSSTSDMAKTPHCETAGIVQLPIGSFSQLPSTVLQPFVVQGSLSSQAHGTHAAAPIAD